MKKQRIQNIRKALTGGAASAEALCQIEPDVMPVYPITPQTPIVEAFAKFQADGKVDTEIITVESEHSAISACVGSSAAGARTVTATSSQGLALMNEILYIASGLQLPILMIISSRALSAPINIHGDHSDVMGARDTGWIQLFSEDAQEVYDNTIIGVKLAEETKIPTMVIMDGFTTSHSVEVLETLSDEIVKNFVGEYQPKDSLLDVYNPKTFGAVALPDSYFEFKIEQMEAMDKVFEEYKKIYFDFQKLKSNQPVARQVSRLKQKKFECFFEEYKTKDAKQVIVLMGSTAGTAKDVVDKMRAKGNKVGLLKIKMFRPFPYREVAKVLRKVKSVAVMERVMPFGSAGPLYSEIVNTVFTNNLVKIQIANYIYSLGGRDIFAEQIEDVFGDLIANKISKKIKFLSKNE